MRDKLVIPVTFDIIISEGERRELWRALVWFTDHMSISERSKICRVHGTARTLALDCTVLKYCTVYARLLL